MKRHLIIGFIILVGAGPIQAQEESATNLSRYELFEDGATVKTLEELQDMEDAYKALLADGNCDAAISAIVEFYEAANLVSNLIRRGSEPYYSARRDDQEAIAKDKSLLSELIDAEEKFNGLIRRRNTAWVEEAKCLLSLGEQQAAVTRLYRALDYISGDERELWEEARTLLWTEVGFRTGN